MDIFLTNAHQLASLLTPEVMWSNFFMMIGCSFLDLNISTTFHYHYKAWKSQDIFKITPIGFV